MNKIIETLGFDPSKVEQGSDEWLYGRLGVITASEACKVFKRNRVSVPRDKAAVTAVADKFFKQGIITEEQKTKLIGRPSKAVGSYSDERKGYMLNLVSEVITGQSPSAKSKQMDYGHEHEPLAREAYEAKTFSVVKESGLIFMDDSMRCGVSLDGQPSANTAIEIKCPYTTPVHLDTLLNGKIKPEYVTQMQFQMWVAGLDKVDFCSFDPRIGGDPSNRLCVIEVEPDQAVFDTFEIEIPKFIEEMDFILDKLGFKFGDQWK